MKTEMEALKGRDNSTTKEALKKAPRQYSLKEMQGL